MFMHNKIWKILETLSYGLLITAATHLWYLFFPDDRTVLRHVVFVVINLGVFIAIQKRWKMLKYFMLLLCAQQLNGHGRDFIAAFEQGRWDIPSLFVIVFLPLCTIMMFVADAKGSKNH